MASDFYRPIDGNPQPGDPIAAEADQERLDFYRPALETPGQSARYYKPIPGNPQPGDPIAAEKGKGK
jgi:hypothetical protein